MLAVEGLERRVPPRPLPGGHAGGLEQLDQPVAVEEGPPGRGPLSSQRSENEPLLRAQAVDLGIQLGHLGGQGLGEVGMRGVEQPADHGQAQPRLPVVADAREPGGVGPAVVPVARGRPFGGVEQPEPVVVQQGAPGEPEPCRQPADRQLLAGARIVPVRR